MSTHTTIHDVCSVKAVAGDTEGAPFWIICQGAEGNRHAEVTLFTGDHALARRLADAINNAMAEHKSALPTDAA